MENPLIELSLQRGRLQERIAAQRAALAGHLRPLAAAAGTADRALAATRRGIDCVQRHPLEVGLGVAVLAVLRPRVIWRWSRRGFFAWQFWKRARGHLVAAGFLGAHPGR